MQVFGLCEGSNSVGGLVATAAAVSERACRD